MKISNKDIDIFSLVMFLAAGLYLINYIREKKLDTKIVNTVETVNDGVSW
tara:strand:- start:685 stop:834 length:150 start_codon:yes stop_codon:yes gene_type:complete